jgi:hypothetical protein
VHVECRSAWRKHRLRLLPSRGCVPEVHQCNAALTSVRLHRSCGCLFLSCPAIFPLGPPGFSYQRLCRVALRHRSEARSAPLRQDACALQRLLTVRRCCVVDVFSLTITNCEAENGDSRHARRPFCQRALACLWEFDLVILGDLQCLGDAAAPLYIRRCACSYSVLCRQCMLSGCMGNC